MGKDYYLFKYNGCRFGKNILFPKGEMRIFRNSLTLITGENGSGKSTLIKKLFYNNYDFITMVGQENDEIFSELTIIENISMLQKNISEDFIKGELEKYGITDILNKLPDKLSGGEKRLVSILRGVCSENELIFLDEPTNDLDYRIVDIIIRIISDYKSEKSFVIVTHDERLYEIADSIYHIENKSIKNKEVSCVEKEDQIEVKRKNILNGSNLFKKIFKTDYIFIYCILVIMVVTMSLFNFYLKKTNVKIERFEDNHIEICNTIYGKHSKLILDGFLPSSLLKDKEISANEFEPSGSYSFGLNIESTGNYDVYNMMLFDISSSSAYSVLDVYGMNMVGEDVKYNVDTSSLFKLSDTKKIDNAQNLFFGREEYEDTYKLIKEEVPDLENVFLIIKPINKYGFNDFLKEKEIAELLEGDYYVRSNETIKIVEEMLELENVKKYFLVWFVAMAFFAIIIIYYIFLNVKYIKNKVNIVANYGFDKDEILSNLVKKCINIKLILSVVLLGEVIMLLMCFLHKDYTIGYLTFPIPVSYGVLMTVLSYIYFWRIKVCVKKINKIEGEF